MYEDHRHDHRFDRDRWRRRVAAACCAVLLVAWSACSTKDDPKQAVLGDRYPENFAFAKERCDRVGYHSLRPRELVVYCLGCFEAEMDNGGFHQFFLNSAGDHTGATIDALESIGATEVRDVLRKATLAAFEGQIVPIDRSPRVRLLNRPSPADEDRLTEKLYALDAEYDEAARTLVDLTNDWLKRSK